MCVDQTENQKNSFQKLKHILPPCYMTKPQSQGGHPARCATSRAYK